MKESMRKEIITYMKELTLEGRNYLWGGLFMTEIEKINQELQDISKMLDYLSNHMNDLPVSLSVCYVAEILKFAERVKPLYISALALRKEES